MNVIGGAALAIGAVALPVSAGLVSDRIADRSSEQAGSNFRFGAMLTASVGVGTAMFLFDQHSKRAHGAGIAAMGVALLGAGAFVGALGGESL